MECRAEISTLDRRDGLSKSAINRWLGMLRFTAERVLMSSRLNRYSLPVSYDDLFRAFNFLECGSTA